MIAENYSFELPDPALNAASWLRDGVHCPNPLPHLVGDVVAAWFSRVMGRPVAMVNGFLFFSLGSGAQTAPYEPAPQADPAEAWYSFYVPRVETVAAWVMDRDWDAMPLQDIVGALDDVWVALASAFASTMAPLGPLGGPLNNLIAFCERYLGNGESTASALLAGSDNATSAIGDALRELARAAAADPALASTVRAGKSEALRSLPTAADWLTDFDAFLDTYGRGNETWFECHKPSWKEDPAVALALIARFMDGAAALGPSREDARRAHLEGALAALPGDAERDHLQSLLTLNAQYIAVIEDRARLQLVLAAAPRAPILAAGRALGASGAISDPDDVFYLRMEELRGVAPLPGPDLLGRRRLDHHEWAALEPPDGVGLPLPPGIERIAMLRQQFGLGAPKQEDDGIVRGFAANAGVVTATARVIQSVEDGERLEPGDILVCRNTAPPWTPLFAIASAVVIESGGILSHAGIAAREYGIPAIVGARNATHLIPDGATVTVDGSAGTVTSGAVPGVS